MPCLHDKCSKEPEWRPVLVVGTRRGKSLRRVSFIHLGYCAEHRASSTVATFLSDEGFDKLAKFLREQGLPKIDQDATTLEWEQISTSELAKLEKTQAPAKTDDSHPF